MEEEGDEQLGGEEEESQHLAEEMRRTGRGMLRSNAE